MRIVFTPHAYAPAVGGAERYTQGLAEELARRGHSVDVVIADIADAEAFYELGHTRVGVRHETLGGVALHRVPYITATYRLAGVVSRFDSRVTARGLVSARNRYERALRAILGDLEPDVVVALPHRFPNVDVTARLHRSARWVLVYAPMLHEADPMWSVERITEIARTADGLIALTPVERERLIEAYGAPPEFTGVIPPAVDLPHEVVTRSRDPIVLYLGRRSSSKRLDALYRAMELVWDAHPGVGLVIAGPAPRGVSDPVEAFGRDPRVTVVEDLSEAEKHDYLDRSVVLVNPSTNESFGITTLEAWSHRLPVVAIDTPVNRCIIRPDVDGTLVAADPGSMAHGILAMLDDPSRASAMGRAGRQRAEREYTWAASATRFENLARVALEARP